MAGVDETKLSVDDCREFFRELLNIELDECMTLSEYYRIDPNSNKDISSGGFGSVFVVRYIDEDNPGLIRAAKIGKIITDAQKRIVNREKEIIDIIRAEKIEGFPKYYREKIGKDKYIFIEDLCKPVDLVFEKFRSDKPKLSREYDNQLSVERIEEVKKLGLDILKSLNALKNKHRKHNDVKKKNIVCKEIASEDQNVGYQYLLCDFGSASVDLSEKPEGTTLTAVSWEQIPPEITPKNHKKYKKCNWDTFGLGVAMYHLLIDKLPYKLLEDMERENHIVNLYSLCEKKEYYYVLYTILKAISPQIEDGYGGDIDAMITDLSGHGDYGNITDISIIEEAVTKTMQPMGPEDLIRNDWINVDESLPEDLKEFISDDSIDIFDYKNNESSLDKPEEMKISDEIKDFLLDDTIDIFDYTVKDSSETTRINNIKSYSSWINDDSVDIFDNSRYIGSGVDDSLDAISLPKCLADWITDVGIDIFS